MITELTDYHNSNVQLHVLRSTSRETTHKLASYDLGPCSRPWFEYSGYSKLSKDV